MSNSLFGTPFDLKISQPRFKFKEYLLDTIDGTEVEGCDYLMISKEHKFSTNVKLDQLNNNNNK